MSVRHAWTMCQHSMCRHLHTTSLDNLNVEYMYTDLPNGSTHQVFAKQETTQTMQMEADLVCLHQLLCSTGNSTAFLGGMLNVSYFIVTAAQPFGACKVS